MSANNIQLINIAISLILVVMTFLFIFRIVLTWYPQVESQKLPFSLVIAPTEPFLAPSRKLIPAIGGVDITPIVWVGMVSLIREVLVGQPGIITMLGSYRSAIKISEKMQFWQSIAELPESILQHLCRRDLENRP